jgi:hypothetical protein
MEYRVKSHSVRQEDRIRKGGVRIMPHSLQTTAMGFNYSF